MKKTKLPWCFLQADLFSPVARRSCPFRRLPEVQNGILLRLDNAKGNHALPVVARRCPFRVLRKNCSSRGYSLNPTAVPRLLSLVPAASPKGGVPSTAGSIGSCRCCLKICLNHCPAPRKMTVWLARKKLQGSCPFLLLSFSCFQLGQAMLIFPSA